MQSSPLFHVPGYRELDLDFEGISTHVWEGGAENKRALILAHGSGAGCQTLSNWKAVLEPLARTYHVLAPDFVGFGLSGWKSSAPYFDMALWQRQLEALVTRLSSKPVGLVGHSFAGPIVLEMAAKNPEIAAVIVTGTAGRSSLPNSGGPGWKFPDDEAMLRKGVGRTVVNPALVDDKEITRRLQILARPGARENFNNMFGGDKQALVEGMTIKDETLKSIRCPTMFMHGLQDASFHPEDTSVPMAKHVRGSTVLIIDQCAHSVALEHPRKFVAGVDMVFDR